jgi:hypothetical protein
MHPHQHRPATAGTREDLLRALDDARSLADQIHQQGRQVATEFIQGRHLLQEEAHIRALVFDFLWSLADEIDRWAERTPRRGRPLDRP